MKEERYQKILDILSDGNYASVNKLSKELFVSLPTIRRDLTEMQKMGLIVRSHGGAVRSCTEEDGPPLYFRKGVNPGLKLKLANTAATLLRDNSLIFLDESSTTLHIVDHVKEYSNINIITNNMAVLQLAQNYKIPAYCLGGKLKHDSMSFYGNEAENMLAHYCIDMMFFSSSAVTRIGLITDYCEEANSLRKKALEHCEKTVFLCDSSKINKHSAYVLMHVRDVNYIVTDGNLTDMDLGEAAVLHV